MRVEEQAGEAEIRKRGTGVRRRAEEEQEEVWRGEGGGCLTVFSLWGKKSKVGRRWREMWRDDGKKKTVRRDGGDTEEEKEGVKEQPDVTV